MQKYNLFIFVIDTSSSMKKHYDIGEVTEYIDKIVARIKKETANIDNEYIAVTTFTAEGHSVLQQPINITKFNLISIEEFINGDADDKILRLIKNKKEVWSTLFHKQQYYLITDNNNYLYSSFVKVFFTKLFILKNENYDLSHKPKVKNSPYTPIKLVSDYNLEWIKNHKIHIFALFLMLLLLFVLKKLDNNKIKNVISQSTKELQLEENLLNKKYNYLSKDTNQKIYQAKIGKNEDSSNFYRTMLFYDYTLQYIDNIKESIPYYPDAAYDIIDDTVFKGSIVIEMAKKIVIKLKEINENQDNIEGKRLYIEIIGEADGRKFTKSKIIKKNTTHQRYILNGNKKIDTLFRINDKLNTNEILACLRAYYLAQYLLEKDIPILKRNENNISFFADTTKKIGGQHRKTKIRISYYDFSYTKSIFSILIIILILFLIINFFYYKFMQPSIQKAIAALQNANYAGYFEEMDKIVPVSLQNPYQEHKGKFMSGNYPYNFYQQLEVFAREVDKSIKNEPANKKGSEADDILAAHKKERIEEIKKQLVMLNKLKSEWEEKEILENNPNEKMKCELEIKKLNVKIAALKEELARLA